MKFLLIRIKKFSFKTVSSLKYSEKISDLEKSLKLDEDCYIVFIGYEKKDSESYITDFIKIITEDKTIDLKKRFILYPYIHITEKPTCPNHGLNLHNKVYKCFKDNNLNCYKIPYGWIKTFSINTVDIPFEKFYSIPILVQNKDPVFLKPNSKIYMVRGNKIVDNFEENNHIPEIKSNSKSILGVEFFRTVVSDSGNITFYDTGFLLKKLIEEYIYRNILESSLNVKLVQTPCILNSKINEISKYLKLFPARQYIFKIPKDRVLRFASCPGMFSLFKEFFLIRKKIPLYFFEMVTSAFRLENKGELKSLRRLRGFTMPDCHGLIPCDPSIIFEELKKLYILTLQIMSGLNLGPFLKINIKTTDFFYNKHGPELLSIFADSGKIIKLELWTEQFYYYYFKFELVLDIDGEELQLSTIQLDNKNAEIYGLKLKDSKEPLNIIHYSPTGSVERIIYALKVLNKIPFWAQPFNFRIIIPFGQNILKDAAVEHFKKYRVEIDISNKTLGSKIKDFYKSSVERYCIFGHEEIKTNKISIIERNHIYNISLTELYQKYTPHNNYTYFSRFIA